MKGHIRERSPGRWAIVVEMRDPETGRRRRKWNSFAGTKRQAQSECARLVAAVDGDSYSEPSKLSVAAYLEEWLVGHKSQVAPRTFERYAQLVRTHLIPLLGGALLSKLNARSIEAAYASALENGRRDRPGGLSPQTVLHMHRVLHQALQRAFELSLISRNPAAQARPPKVERHAMNVLDASGTARLLAHFRSTRAYMPVLLAAMCGLRRGEILALRWKDVDLVNATLAVSESLEQTKAGVRRKETKGGRARNVVLPALVIPELRRHRISQAQELLKCGVGLDDETPVCAKEDGGILQPDSLTHEFVRILAQDPSLPRIRFHDLRHGHATQMLKSGIHPKIAQERLGHSTIGITLDLYSHVMPGMQADAVAKVDEVMAAAIETHARKQKGVG